MIEAPAAKASRITFGSKVSTEIGMSQEDKASTSGKTRSISSWTEMLSAPGRVDCPPISMMSAPSFLSCSACRRAASLFRKSPPSLKESAVTLRIPIILGTERSNLNFPHCQRRALSVSISFCGVLKNHILIWITTESRLYIQARNDCFPSKSLPDQQPLRVLPIY